MRLEFDSNYLCVGNINSVKTQKGGRLTVLPNSNGKKRENRVEIISFRRLIT